MIKPILRPIFTLWERFFSWKEKITTLEGSPYKLIRYRIHPYKGKTVLLPDGAQISDNDYVLEIHISNISVANGKIGDIEISSDLRLLSIVKEEIMHLAQLLKENKLDPRVKAIWSITLFSPAMRRLGFTSYPMEPGWNRTSLKLWMEFLRWVFAPARVNSRSKSRAARQPEVIFISKEYLFKKYL